MLNDYIDDRHIPFTLEEVRRAYGQFWSGAEAHDGAVLWRGIRDDLARARLSRATTSVGWVIPIDLLAALSLLSRELEARVQRFAREICGADYCRGQEFRAVRECMRGRRRRATTVMAQMRAVRS